MKVQKIGVSGFIHKDGKLLVLRRSKKEKFMSGYYDLPGGKVEFGESLKDALSREIKEETNLIVSSAKPYSSFSYVTLGNTRHTVDIQFLVEVEGFDNMEISDAHDEYKWIREKQLNDFKMSDERKKSIEEGFREINKN